MKFKKIFLFTLLAILSLSFIYKVVFATSGSGSATVTVNCVLSYSANTGGSITGTSSQTIECGTNGTAVTATATTGYTFSSWSDGITTATRTDTNVATDKSVTASFTVSSYSVTPSAGAGGTISPNTLQTVNHGSTTTFTVSPNSGYKASVAGTCGGSLSGTTYTTNAITGNCTVVASFVQMTGTLTSSAASCTIPAGSSSCNVNLTWATTNPIATSAVTASGMTDVNGNSGTSVAFAVPYGGRTFFLYNNSVLLAQTANITSSCAAGVWNGSICAQYTVTPSAGANVTISPNTAQTVNHNATTQFTVSPSAGYTASVAGTCGGSLAGTIYTTNAITGNCTVIASATINSYTVSASAGTGGSISPASRSVNHGANTTFTVTPDTGYSINTVTGCSGSLSGATYTTGAITAACTVTASFTINSYTVSTSAGTGGSISPASRLVNHGSNTTFTVTANTNNAIKSVTGCSGSLSGATYTTGAITANCTVTATFMYGTLSASNCSISAAGTTCSTTLIWSTTNPVGTSSVTTNYPSANTTVATANSSAGTTYLVPEGTTTFYLYNNSVLLATATAIGTRLAPAIPTGLTATPSTCETGIISVSWAASSGATSYILQDNGSTIYSGASTSYPHGSLSAASSHNYKVLAVNSGGSSSYSSVVGSTAPGYCSYSITSSAGTGGSITPAGVTSVSSGGSQSYSISPTNGSYYILSVLVDGISQGAISSYNFTNVNANHTISVSFTQMTGTLTSSAASCTIPAGSSSCNVNLTWTVTNPIGATTAITASGMTNYTSPSVSSGGPTAFAVPYGGRTFFLYNNSVALAQTANITSSCAAGVWNGSICAQYTVTPSAGANVTISPNTAQTVNHNATTQFTVSPSAGYTASVAGTCGGSLAGTIYTTNAITGNCTVIASATINSYTVSASAGTGGSISPASRSVNHGANTTFTVSPNSGYKASVAGTCGGSLSGTTYTTNAITGNCTVVASFVQMTGTLTSSAASCTIPAGSSSCNVNLTWATTNPIATSAVTASGMTDVNGNSGTSVAFAVPYGGRTFFLYNNSVLLAQTANITSSCAAGVWNGSICAQYTVTPSAGANVTISPNTAQTVNHNATTQFTVSPSAGYTASVAGTCGGSLAGTIYTTNAITGNCTVIASATINSYTVSASAGTGGSISPASRSVNHGANTTFTVTPDTGYSINTVTGCSGSLSGATYTTGAITAACTVTASFTINSYTVSTSAGTGGSISPASRLVNHGSNTTFTVTANTNNAIKSVTGCSGSLSGATYTTGAITANCTVTATFMYGTLSASSPSCLITSGNSSCNVNLTWSTTNPIATSAVTASGMTDYGGNSGTNIAFAVPYSSRNFFLYNNSILLAQTSVSSSCSSNTHWNGSICITDTYTVSTSAGAGGSISPVSRSVNHGSTTTFTITPNTGYSINTVTGCSGSLSGATYTTGAITSACTVTASFKQMTGHLSPASTSCVIGTGSGGCSISLNWDITNPISSPTAITASGMIDINVTNTLISPQSGSQLVAVPYSSRTFFLYNNGVELASSYATSDCSAVDVWNGSICTPRVCSAPLTQEVSVACDINAYGYNALSGVVTRSQNKTAYPECIFGTPVTNLNSTYVTDNCVYPQLPIVTSPTDTSVKAKSATLGATVESLGFPASITARGICYGTSHNPDLSESNGAVCGKDGNNVTTGIFTINIINKLSPSTTYFYRGYATNPNAGTGYSTEGTFTTKVLPPEPTSTFTSDKAAQSNQIKFGEAVKLTWTSANSDNCSITSTPAPSVDKNNLYSSGNISFKPSKTTIYSLVCTGEGGSSPLKQIQITVGKIKPTFNEL